MNEELHKVISKYLNEDRKALEEDSIFITSNWYHLPPDKHLEYYRDISEVVSAEDAWEAFKERREKIMREEEQWVKEEDSDSWDLILEKEKNKNV